MKDRFSTHQKEITCMEKDAGRNAGEMDWNWARISSGLCMCMCIKFVCSYIWNICETYVSKYTRPCIYLHPLAHAYSNFSITFHLLAHIDHIHVDWYRNWDICM